MRREAALRSPSAPPAPADTNPRPSEQGQTISVVIVWATHATVAGQDRVLRPGETHELPASLAAELVGNGTAREAG